MAPDVTKFEHLGGTTINVAFADGSERRIDLASLVRPHGVFANFNTPGFIATGRVNADTGTIEWPGGGDLSPDTLYAAGALSKQGHGSAA